MKKKLDIEDIKNKLYEKLKESGWDIKLRSYIYSSDFDNIIKQLARLSLDGKRFTPPLSKIFNSFIECPLDKLKVVIVSSDPYSQFGIADGIAFSCGNTLEKQPPLIAILDEINKDVYFNKPKSIEPNLARWSRQGVLLLNTALTTTVNRNNQHYAIWKSFMAYLFDYLTWNVNGLVYIYMGKEASNWADGVNDNNYKYHVSNPSLVGYDKTTTWDSKNVFNKTNKILEKNYGTKIIW